MINNTHMGSIAKAASITSLAILFSGCAPMISGAMNMSVTPDVVAQKTAKYFSVAESSLQISNIEKQALATSYQVRNAGKLYNCTIYYGEVQCKQPGS